MGAGFDEKGGRQTPHRRLPAARRAAAVPRTDHRGEGGPTRQHVGLQGLSDQGGQRRLQDAAEAGMVRGPGSGRQRFGDSRAS